MAQATPITYDFTLTFANGVLSGQVESGHFSFDSSSVTPGASNDNTGLLTDLAVTIDGVAYDETMANTASLGFDMGGNLASFLFGTDCSASGCDISTFDPGSWAVSNNGASAAGAQFGRGLSSGVVRFALQQGPRDVPEPATLALLLLAAGVARFSVRRPS